MGGQVQLLKKIKFPFLTDPSWKLYWACDKNVISMTFVFADDCRILKFNPELKDFSLQGFVIKSVEVQRESECKVRCFQENNCLSFNIGPSEENGAYLCELSDSDHEMHPEALKPTDGFNYHSTEVSFLDKQDLKQFTMCSEFIEISRCLVVKGECAYRMVSS